MNIIRFFDKLEDKIRGFLSHFPIVYAIIGGIGVVLFWRGVWHTADAISVMYIFSEPGTISFPNMYDGLISFGIGMLLLLLSGLFVSTFIGNEIIISGLRGEKRIAEKTEKEVKTEAEAIEELKKEIQKIANKLDSR